MGNRTLGRPPPHCSITCVTQWMMTIPYENQWLNSNQTDFHYKPSILGYPCFLETPICQTRTPQSPKLNMPSKNDALYANLRTPFWERLRKLLHPCRTYTLLLRLRKLSSLCDLCASNKDMPKDIILEIHRYSYTCRECLAYLHPSFTILNHWPAVPVLLKDSKKRVGNLPDPNPNRQDGLPNKLSQRFNVVPPEKCHTNRRKFQTNECTKARNKNLS